MTYDVTLKVSNAFGCYDSITRPVYKGPCVIAAFEPVDPPYCDGNPVCFVNNSLFNGTTGALDQWRFEYGDGNVDVFSMSPDTVCHIFDEPGTYQVLFIIGATVAGFPYLDTASLIIEISPSPTANFTTSLNCSNQGTFFEDMSEGNGNEVVSWEWDFGDPTTTEDTAVIQDPSYNYPSAGTFTVQQIVTSNIGCIDTLIQDIEVFDPPMAEFSSSVACQNEFTDFFDETVPAGPEIYSWYWSFGDPGSATDTSVIQDPSYMYEGLGIYDVTLIVEDLNQCRDTITKEVMVYETPLSGFTLIENYRNTQGVVLLTNTSQGAESYEWDFGNGETSNEINPEVAYTEDDTYLIQLIAYNEYGCPDTSFFEYELMFKGLYMPSAFVPEGEKDIRLWTPVGVNLRRYRVEVYTLWGNLVFESTLLNDGSPVESWNGRLNNNQGDLMPPGNYIWKASGTFRDGSVWRGMEDEDGEFRTSGVITVIR